MLTDKEFELLNKGFDAIRSSNLVDVHVKNIRKKLERPKSISLFFNICRSMSYYYEGLMKMSLDLSQRSFATKEGQITFK